jgi:glyoxylase-like metal-dependent hydrolase (beta-lactamase superfamily II)
LIDDAYHSELDAYDASLERLLALPVEVVHGGHFGSFGRDRLVEIVAEYRAGRRAAGCHLRAE